MILAARVQYLVRHASYHNHTVWSDGRGSVEDMVRGAEAIGIAELGISDHLVLRGHGPTPSWSLDPADLDAYFDELVACRAASRVPLRIGLEVDWFTGAEGRIAAALAGRPLDFVVGSVHEVGAFVLDASPMAWDRLDEETRNAMHRAYWLLTAEMAESGLVDIAAHLDLPRKFGHYATIDLGTEIDAALDAIAEAGMVVEVNTAGWHKPCRDGYPGVAILERCRARDIAVTISADAHDPAHLARDFERARERLREAGYEEVVRFRKRQQSRVRL